MDYEIYFRRPNDCVVYPANGTRDVSLLHRQRDGEWHCALCDSTRCRHTDVAVRAAEDREGSSQPVG